jgi:hypothetical protein
MKASEWIICNLQKYNGDKAVVYSMYDNFLKETKSDATYSSFQRKVRKVSNLFSEKVIDNNKTTTQPYEEGDTYKHYDKEEVIKILQDTTKELNKRLSINDVYTVCQQFNMSFDEIINMFGGNVVNLLNTLYKDFCFNKDEHIKIHRLEEQIKDLRKENKQIISEESETLKILDVLNNIASTYERPKYNRIKLANNKNKKSLVLLLSDLHFDEIVLIEEMYGINEYNPDIAKMRIKSLFAKVVETAILLNVDTLHIEMLGDMINGIIHEGEINADLSILESIIQLSDFLCQCIVDVSSYFKTININAVTGNHGRIKQKPHYKNKTIKNFEYILYHFMKKELKNIVNKFEIPKSPFMVDDILGYSLLLMHGDSFTGGGGWSQVPGTIARDVPRISALLSQIGKEIYATCIGHFHVATSIHDFAGKEVIINGTTVGTNEFSIGKLKKGSLPAQTTFLIEENIGIRFRDIILLE